MKHDFARIIKQKSGVAIMSVMLFFMVMMIMIGGLTISSQSNAKVAGESADYTAAFYAAEAGITHVTNDFRNLMNNSNMTLAQFVNSMHNIITANESTIINLSDSGGQNVRTLIEFEDENHDPLNMTFQFTIVSTGTVGIQSRTLKTFVDLNYGSSAGGNNQAFAIRHAVLVRNNLITRNNSVIRSHNPSTPSRISTFSHSHNAMNLAGNTNFTGTIELTSQGYVNRNSVVTSRFRNAVDHLNRVTSTPFSILEFAPIQSRASTTTLQSVSNITTLMNTRNTAGERVMPAGNYFMTHLDFDALSGVIRADQNVFIVTDKLTLGNATFVGDGTVTIYVKPGTNTFAFPASNNSGFGNMVNPHRLVVYVDQMTTASTVTLSNNSTVHGSFMFKNTSITLNNNTTFGGYLMTEGANVNLSNNGSVTTTFYFVPLGNVVLSNNAVVRGAVIANNATINNNAVVIYDPAFVTHFPFSIASPVATNTPTPSYGILNLNIHRTTER